MSAATAVAVPPPEAKSLAKCSDGITGLSFMGESENATPTSTTTKHHLVASSWDGTVRIFDTATGNAVLTQTMEAGPLLSMAITPTSQVVIVGGIDGSVKMLEIATTTVTLVGKHRGMKNPPETTATTTNNSTLSTSLEKNGVSCIAALSGTLVASASWNGQLILWNIQTQEQLATINLPGKAFSMDVDREHQRLIVATAGRRNIVVEVDANKQDSNDGDDTNKTTSASLLKVVVDRESSLKFQTRCVAFFPNTGFALGSVEGRVGVEYLEELGLAQGKKYAFKCHRIGDRVYPVNCIQFHPKYTNTFATGGCDGSVVLWDGGNKKKLTTLPTFPTSISALAFNHDGTELAIAASYTFEEGDREHPQDEIFLRKILDSECQPKAK